MNQKGLMLVPILLISLVCILLFLFASSTFPVRDNLFGSLYQKPKSNASEKAIEQETKATNITWFDMQDIGLKWDVDTSCTQAEMSQTLNISCNNGQLRLKEELSRDKNTIVSVEVSGNGQNSSSYSVGLGFAEKDNSVSQELALQAYSAQFPDQADSLVLVKKSSVNKAEGEVLSSVNNNQKVKLKIVYSKISDKNYFYYYMNDSADPIYKGEAKLSEPVVFLSCNGKCSFGPVLVSHSSN